MSKEYIEKKALLDTLNKSGTPYNAVINDIIIHAPTVTIVTCKDCKWYGVDREKGQFCLRPTSPAMWRDDITPLKPDDYCSYGVRKNDRT